MEVAAWPQVIELEAPIVAGEDEITSLSFPQPLARHVRRAGGDSITFGALMAIAADWCGQPQGVIKGLGARDARRVMRLMSEALRPLENAAFDPETMVVPSLPVTLSLRSPVQFGQRTLTELTIKSCRVSHFYGMPAASSPVFGDYLDAAARMLGEPARLVDLLSIEDGVELVRTVRGFFHSFQAN